MSKLLFRSSVCLLLSITCTAAMAIEYPTSRRVDQTDDYHGTIVADPYRWLEQDVRQAPEVADWVAAQNKVTSAYLASIPARERIQKRLTALYNFERFSPPSRKGDNYFYQRNDGLQNQSVLYVAKSPTAEGRVLLDPNTWSDDGTIAIGDFLPSDDGQLLVYSKSSAGSDWRTIHVLDVETGEHHSDVLEWHRFGGIEWAADGKGFYYNRYPKPKDTYQSLAVDQKIYFHKLGDSQDKDMLVYERPDQPDWTFGLSRTHDGEYLVLEISRGTDPQNQVLVRSATDPKADWQTLVGNFDHQYSFVGHQDGRLYFVTDQDAPTKRVVATPAGQPADFSEVVPASEFTIEGARLVGGRLIVQSLRDVQSNIGLYTLAGEPAGEIKLPGAGTAIGFGGEWEHTETFYLFTNLVTPSAAYRYDFATGKSEVIRQPKLDFDPAKYTVKQVFVTSRDGTRVPMTIAHRADVKADGKRPTLLYSYGGFSISILPAFSVDYAVWMEMGGIVAIANLRGGGEYGEAWHQAGKREKKQNVFDDFIAAGEWLIDNGYTSSKRLAIRGGSNGGLLVGAVMTQRPDLFGACLPAVGVHDMLRFHQFTAGQFWRDEFGSADDPAEFAVLKAYSPYHNVRDGVEYPATLITTADTDDRVVPMHSFKFGAALQHAQAGDAPILLHIETRAGHGAGTPTSKRIEQAADAWAFMVDQFDYGDELDQHVEW